MYILKYLGQLNFKVLFMDSVLGHENEAIIGASFKNLKDIKGKWKEEFKISSSHWLYSRMQLVCTNYEFIISKYVTILNENLNYDFLDKYSHYVIYSIYCENISPIINVSWSRSVHHNKSHLNTIYCTNLTVSKCVACLSREKKKNISISSKRNLVKRVGNK